MRARRISLLGIAALALAACQPKTAGGDAPVDLAREADAIRGAEADRAIQTGEKDLDMTASHFAPNAMLTWPGTGPIRGAVQIRSSFKASFEDPAFALDWKTDRIVVARQGDLGWTSGVYTLTRTDPATKAPKTVRGPFLETFTKSADGHWLISAGVLGELAPPNP